MSKNNEMRVNFSKRIKFNVQEYMMDLIIKNVKVPIGTCEKCGSKVFINYN